MNDLIKKSRAAYHWDFSHPGRMRPRFTSGGSEGTVENESGTPHAQCIITLMIRYHR